MRFISVFLISLIAVSSIAVAQSLPNRGGGGWTRPGGPSIGPKVPGIRPGGPSIFIPPTTGRSCPKGTVGKWPACISVETKRCPEKTTGKWPNCKPKSTASCAQKGMVGKWPNCRAPDVKRCPKGTAGDWPNCIEIAKPSDNSCPEGRVRKGGNCVELTKSDPGKGAPPRAKTKN